MTIDELVKVHVLKTLEESTSKASAAKKLGICIRTLRNYLHSWGLHHLIGPHPYELRENRYSIVTSEQRDAAYNWSGH